METPLVSVVIVTYNSRSDLEACLPTLSSQQVPLEVIVVDNGSKDGTLEWVRETHPDIFAIQNTANDGYAGGNNLGVQAARGKYILILNPDTELHQHALEKMVKVLIEHPAAIVTPKLLRPDGTINACGNKMHITGITTCNGLGEPPEMYHGVFSVFLLSGATFLIERSVWDNIGGFSKEYFMYMEDVDFSLRARLLGYEIFCCAEANVLHKWDLRLNPRKFFYLERNRLLTLLKLYKARTFARLWFSFLLTETATWGYAALRGFPFLKARVQSYWSVWQMRKQLRESRELLQSNRKVSDKQLLAQMSSTLPFDMVVSPRLAKVLVKTTTPFYKAFYIGGDRT